MPFSQMVKDLAFARAGGRCECTRLCWSHVGQRCNADLTWQDWEAHHIVSQLAGGADTLANCEVLCVPCHQNTHSYGRS
jgi:5-methylcytosine-specific restriction endonuclease McrA